MFGIFYTVAILVLLALAGAALLHAYSTYVAWAIDQDRTEQVESESVRYGEGWQFVRLVLAEMVRTFGMLALYPIGFIDLPVRDATLAPGRRPVLLVHGYMMNWSNFVVLMWRLRKAGIGPIYVVNLGARVASMDSAARRLSAHIDHILDATSGQDIDVVAHSMGGLVTRLVMAWDGPRHRIRRLVTLGTPHGGTRLARLGLGPKGRAMCEGSSFLAALSAPERVVSISSEHDSVVFPAANAVVGSPGEDVLLSGYGHFGLITDAEPAFRVIEALADQSKT
jgi:triacylglycerol lipase